MEKEVKVRKVGGSGPGQGRQVEIQKKFTQIAKKRIEPKFSNHRVGGEALYSTMWSFPEMKFYSYCAPCPRLQGRVCGAPAGQIRPWAP